MIASTKARLTFRIRLYRTTLVVRQTPRRRNQDAFLTLSLKPDFSRRYGQLFIMLDLRQLSIHAPPAQVVTLNSRITIRLRA
jgi:hypothetical protein